MITVTIVKIKMKKITLKMFIKLKKYMKIIPTFLQMQNRKNLNLGKITIFIIQLKMKTKNVYYYAGY